MKKKIISCILALLFTLSLFPASSVLAEDGFYDYQKDVLRCCNEHHNGAPLVLDARLCALAAALAVEQDGRGEMTAYRPDGEKWDTVFSDYGYVTERASSGCNWIKTKAKPSAQAIVEYWMKTPGFKENIGSAMFTHTGIYMHYSASAKCYYIVQLFTKPADNQDTSYPAEALAVAIGGVNIRSGPGTNYSRLGTLSKGRVVSVLSVSGKWAKIILSQNQSGYVHTDYIKFVISPIAPAVDVPSTDPGTIGAAVATGNVNVRKGPGTNYEKLGTLRKGQTVAVWTIHGLWAEITWTGSQRGYVHIDYLRFEEESTMPTLAVPSTDPGTVGAAVATGNVNVRKGPGTNYEKLGTLRKGQTVAVWAIYGHWAEITWTGSQRGYVHTNYLRMK